MILKFLGVVDILSALIILFNIYHLHWAFDAFFILILIGKGLTSIRADLAGMTMGSADIISGIFILFSVIGLLPIKIILVILLVSKGLFSIAS